jgi:hypothetical protein
MSKKMTTRDSINSTAMVTGLLVAMAYNAATSNQSVLTFFGIGLGAYIGARVLIAAVAAFIIEPLIKR